MCQAHLPKLLSAWFPCLIIYQFSQLSIQLSKLSFPQSAFHSEIPKRSFPKSAFQSELENLSCLNAASQALLSRLPFFKSAVRSKAGQTGLLSLSSSALAQLSFPASFRMTSKSGSRLCCASLLEQAAFFPLLFAVICLACVAILCRPFGQHAFAESYTSTRQHFKGY